MFPAATYIARRQQLIDQIDKGILLLMGNKDVGMNYRANPYPFRQDSSFLYYCGLHQSGLAAVVDVDEQKTTLFGDDFSLDDVVWMGPQPAIADRAAAAGIQHTAPFAKLAEQLREAKEKGRTIHFLPPYRHETMIQLESWLGIPTKEQAAKASAAFVRAVVAQRSIKEDQEIREMEQAVNITGAMHKAAMRGGRPGILESQLVGIVEGISIAMGAGVAYPVILSVDGQTLHNHYHGNELKSGQLVLGDFGAQTHSRYAGDITRTFPVDKTFTTRQKEIYQIVLDTEVAAIEACRPGVPYQEIHKGASLQIAEGLTALGLMKGDPAEAVAAGAHALFFPHGLGHMIGLDVHDMEDLGEDLVGYSDTVKRSDQFGTAYLRLGRELEPGFVLTVEPGIYFIPELVNSWKAEGKFSDFINYEKVETYLDFGGIRIEDNVLVTKNGHRILGQPIPKSIAEVEDLRKG
jgi:Xaa-Pro aminopeptidase